VRQNVIFVTCEQMPFDLEMKLLEAVRAESGLQSRLHRQYRTHALPQGAPGRRASNPAGAG